MKSKMMWVALVAAFGFGLAGCKGGESGTPAASGASGAQPAASADAQKIGVTIYKYDDNFMSVMRKALEEAAGGNKGVELIMNDSQNNQSTQNDQVDVLIAKGVKALAINLVDPAAGPTIISKAQAAGIPVVFFNKDPGEAVIASYDKAYYVGANPIQSGEIQGQLIASEWKKHPEWDLNKDQKIQYVLLKGEPGHPDAEARTKYSVKTLNDGGVQTEELYLDTGMWDTAKAKDIMQAWLSGPKAKNIELVITNNDAMAMGAIEAMKAQGNKLPTFGVDGLAEALQLISKDELSGTVLNDGVNQGKAVFALSANLAGGKDAVAGTEYKLDKKYVRIPYVGINKDNLSQFMK